MALKFAKKQSPSKAADTKKSSGAGVSFLKKGAAAAKLSSEEDARVEARQSQYGKSFRFRIPYTAGKNNETQITFLDGDLNSDGMLDVPYFREHTVKINGSWQNFVCTEDDEGYCPICANGEYNASFVGLLSVIDHTPYTIQKGANAGKVIEHSVKLFVAKKSTLQLMTGQAMKRDGLTGCTFEVSRTGDREPSVGNQFDYVQKDNLTELCSENGWEEKIIVPLNYGEELTYYTVDELVELGLGPAQSGPGTEKPIDKEALADKM